ncbi:hypothetical protein NL676_021265 [Syzygium grande]|nr:hypothetical protein NL676_021265 [Syzygium grande]
MNVREARAVEGELREELEGEEIGVEGLMTRDLREARLWRVRGIPVKLAKGSRDCPPELANVVPSGLEVEALLACFCSVTGKNRRKNGGNRKVYNMSFRGSEVNAGSLG